MSGTDRKKQHRCSEAFEGTRARRYGFARIEKRGIIRSMMLAREDLKVSSTCIQEL